MCDDEPVSSAHKVVLRAMGYDVVVSTRMPVRGLYAIKYPDPRPWHHSYLGKFSYHIYESEDDAWSAASEDHQARLRLCH